MDKKKPSHQAMKAALRIINDVPQPRTVPEYELWVAERVQDAIDEDYRDRITGSARPDLKLRPF